MAQKLYFTKQISKPHAHTHVHTRKYAAALTMPPIPKAQGVAEIVTIEKSYLGRKLSAVEREQRKKEMRGVYVRLLDKDKMDIMEVSSPRRSTVCSAVPRLLAQCIPERTPA